VFNALVRALLLRPQLSLVGFTVHAVHQCAEGNERQVQSQKDQNVDEGNSVDQVLDPLEGE